MKGPDDRKDETRKINIIIICVFCLDLVLAFKLREGWRRDVGSPFVFYKPFDLASSHILSISSKDISFSERPSLMV